jgi:small subunit ribosomal protein S18
MSEMGNRDGRDGRDGRDAGNRDGSREASGRDGGRKSVRSKYRSEFPGDFQFDYKDAITLSRFISEGGKVTPARISKLSLAQQRRVASAVKKARNLALLPTGTMAYDLFDRPEPISPKPFSLD